MTAAVDRAAEIIACRLVVPVPWVLICETPQALAAADPPLLVTDEIQAVLDAAVRFRRSPHNREIDPELNYVVDAYLASRPS